MLTVVPGVALACMTDSTKRAALTSDASTLAILECLHVSSFSSTNPCATDPIRALLKTLSVGVATCFS